MSYNINTARYLTGKLRIRRYTGLELANELGRKKRWLPESNFLDEIEVEGSPDDMVEITNPWWSGEGSGNAYDTLIKEVLPKTMGTATLVFIWEGGDSTTGLKVKDGKVTEAKLKLVVDE